MIAIVNADMTFSFYPASTERLDFFAAQLSGQLTQGKDLGTSTHRLREAHHVPNGEVVLAQGTGGTTVDKHSGPTLIFLGLGDSEVESHNSLG